MKSSSLDQWVVTTSTSKMAKPLIVSDAHAHYLYEQSYGRAIERMYENQIENKLAEERAEKEAHEDYVSKNYIRVGGN